MQQALVLRWQVEFTVCGYKYKNVSLEGFQHKSGTKEVVINAGGVSQAIVSQRSLLISCLKFTMYNMAESVYTGFHKNTANDL
jgi:hypothetical protein